MHSGKQNEIWTIRSGGRSKKFGRPQGVLMLLIRDIKGDSMNLTLLRLNSIIDIVQKVKE